MKPVKEKLELQLWGKCIDLQDEMMSANVFIMVNRIVFHEYMDYTFRNRWDWKLWNRWRI